MFRRGLLRALVAVPFSANAAAGPLRVVASFSILGDLVRQVGQARVAVETLVGADQDVHVYDPSPRDLRGLTGAGVLVRNGLGLEGWMDRLTASSGFKGIVVTAAATVTPHVMETQTGGTRDRRPQGASTAIDPHAWQDPRNGERYVAAIADGLAAADPTQAAAYRDAAAGYSAEIRTTDAWIEATLAAIPLPARRIVTTHEAFGYYGARYGVAFLSAEGLSTDSEPSAKGIAALVAQIRREKVRTVFIEAMASDRMARMLARETGSTIGGTVYSDALSAPDGPAGSYLAMLRHNTTLFAAAMQAG